MRISKTLLGLAAIAMPYLDTLHQVLASTPQGVLPPQAKLVIGGLGWLLAFYGRLVAKGPILK